MKLVNYRVDNLKVHNTKNLSTETYLLKLNIQKNGFQDMYEQFTVVSKLIEIIHLFLRAFISKYYWKNFEKVQVVCQGVAIITICIKLMII